MKRHPKKDLKEVTTRSPISRLNELETRMVEVEAHAHATYAMLRAAVKLMGFTDEEISSEAVSMQVLDNEAGKAENLAGLVAAGRVKPSGVYGPDTVFLVINDGVGVRHLSADKLRPEFVAQLAGQAPGFKFPINGNEVEIIALYDFVRGDQVPAAPPADVVTQD